MTASRSDAPPAAAPPGAAPAAGGRTRREPFVPREFSLVVPADWFCVPLLDDDVSSPG